VTAAAPAVAPVRQAPAPYLVRLRVRTHAWSSPAMTQHEAEQLRDGLTARLVSLGDGPGFVQFAGRDGKTFDVRAREVVAVEVAPEGQDQPRSFGGPMGLTIQEGPASDGTAYLRQQASRLQAESGRRSHQ
jgi:hypothetical protein